MLSRSFVDHLRGHGVISPAGGVDQRFGRGFNIPAVERHRAARPQTRHASFPQGDRILGDTRPRFLPSPNCSRTESEPRPSGKILSGIVRLSSGMLVTLKRWRSRVGVDDGPNSAGRG